MQLTPAPDKPIGMTAPRARSRLAMLCLVLALIFQGFVTQTHAHFAGEPGWNVAATSRATTTAAEPQKQTPGAPACLLCEEKALFGAYLLTGSIMLAVPVAVAHDPVDIRLAPFANRPSSHAWRSRAPPILTA